MVELNAKVFRNAAGGGFPEFPQVTQETVTQVWNRKELLSLAKTWKKAVLVILLNQT